MRMNVGVHARESEKERYAKYTHISHGSLRSSASVRFPVANPIARLAIPCDLLAEDRYARRTDRPCDRG